MPVDPRDTPMSGPLTAAFGVRVGGVPLLLPDDLSCEFIARVAVFPLPSAGERVIGLAQLRGQPVVVLEPQAVRRHPVPEIRQLPVLVMGNSADSAALHVPEAPRPIAVGAPVQATPPDCAFSAALRGAMSAAEGTGADAQPWWRFEPRVLFECLAGSS